MQNTLKVTSVIKHRNIANKIITYTHTVYFLLLKLEKNKTKYNILTFTLHICSPWHANFASDLCSVYISLRSYTNMMVSDKMNITQNVENLFMKKF